MNAPNLRSAAISRFRPWTFFVAILSLSNLIGCDDARTSFGGSGDETSTVAFYRPDGKPAAGARVMIYGSADTGASPRDQVIADSRGRVELPVLDKGFYNLVVREDGTAVFQDSLFSNGERMLAASDTLRATGVLVGRLRVQPQHSPRIAWVHLLGAGKYLNVDDSGFFRMDGVPQGKFTMAALTRLSDYTPTFKEVRTVSDSVVDVGIIELVYTGLPVVQNLEARFDTLAGRVFLRWDSLALRETWRYHVYRNDSLLGETAGPRWEDDVSKQYAAYVPAQGLHTYRVALANPDSIGPKWESITMRVISAYLYQDVTIDWERLADLPWEPGLFKVDTMGGALVAWRSAEFGRIMEEWDVRNVHPGMIEMWVSQDSGRNWSKLVDSLTLGSLPERYEGKWWSIRRAAGPIILDDRSRWAKNAGLKYDSVQVVTSEDGLAWREEQRLIVPEEMAFGTFRFQVWDKDLYLVGSGPWLTKMEDGWWVSQYFADLTKWKHQSGIGFQTSEVVRNAEMVPYGTFNWKHLNGGPLFKQLWIDGKAFSLISTSGTTNLECEGFRSPWVDGFAKDLFAWDDAWVFASDIKALPLEGGGWMVFGSRMAITLDNTLSILHTMDWPGAFKGSWNASRPTGLHEEILFGGKILSWTESGIFQGAFKQGNRADPRGTWVKKTEIPVQY